MNLQNLTLSEIAFLIRKNWMKPYFGSIPYLEAMETLNVIDPTDPKSDYGLDSGESIVLYFLSNANSFRGETAREIKKELKRRCGVK